MNKDIEFLSSSYGFQRKQPSSEITEETIAEECDVSVIGKVLELHIGRCSENNDMYRLLGVDSTILYKALPPKKQKAIFDMMMEANYQISAKISKGELTPMMMDKDNKSYGYLKFYYYLTRTLVQKDSKKAKQFAFEVYNEILSDTTLIEKDGILAKYSELLA
jgi:hypothetical protein